MAKKTTKTAKTDVSGTNSGEENILKWLKDHPRIEVSAEAEETEAPAKAAQDTKAAEKPAEKPAPAAEKPAAEKAAPAEAKAK